MKKIMLAFILFTCSISFVSAQDRQLIVKSSDKGLYLDHVIAPKEGMYSIGRLYNVNPKHIAAFNKVDMNKGLNIGEVIRIPLTDTNFTQKSSGGVPVYYEAGDKDGLMAVSNANKKVSLQNLRDWNSLTGDKVNPGQKLVVGFLQSKEMGTASVQLPVKAVPVTKPVVKEEIPQKEVVKTETKPEIKDEPKPVVPEKKIEESKPVAMKKEEPKMFPPKQESAATVNTGTGYFKTSYDQQLRSSPASKNETVTSGIFKTTSGWEDTKYYLLIDKVSPGTIVKVVNPDNNKAVYAKVLGEMNGIRQNQGLDIRISNAAASALGVADPDKFIVKVNY